MSMTVRLTKSGTRITRRQKSGKARITQTHGAGKKSKNTLSQRVGKTTYIRNF
jgi:hypothetical protein